MMHDKDEQKRIDLRREIARGWQQCIHGRTGPLNAAGTLAAIRRKKAVGRKKP